jgi:hypothetical protein
MQMSPFVRHYISHQNLKQLLRLGTYNLPDLEKVRGNLDKGVKHLNTFVRDAIASSTNSSTTTLLIPPVSDPNAPTAVTLERLEQKKKGKGPLTDLEIENAIGDLLDYFEVTFATLKESLTPDGAPSFPSFPPFLSGLILLFVQPGNSSSAASGRRSLRPSRVSSYRLSVTVRLRCAR